MQFAITQYVCLIFIHPTHTIHACCTWSVRMCMQRARGARTIAIARLRRKRMRRMRKRKRMLT